MGRPEEIEMRLEQERAIKEALFKELMKLKRNSLIEIADWLYEEYGIKSEPTETELRAKILSSKDVTSHDLAVLIIENGGYVNEELWFSANKRNLRNDKQNKKAE